MNTTYFSVLIHLLKEHTATHSLTVNAPVVELDSERLTRAKQLVQGASEKSKADAPLNSIFENLGKSTKTYTHSLPLQAIDIDIDSKAAYPIKTNVTQQEWLDGFRKDIETWAAANPTPSLAQTDTFLFVLQRWTANLSSGYGQDISFYDFAKLTAAAYTCLEQSETGKILFVGGGVSGIQNYLFDIVSKNAAKNLKGRSFYLHVLVEAMLFKILKALDLPLGHVVFSSGSNFTFIAPDTTTVTGKLNALKNDIADNFFKTHHIALNTELAWQGFTAEQFQNDYPSVCQGLAGVLAEEKKHRFNRQILHNFKDLFEPIEQGGETRRDVITNEEIAENKNVFILGEAVPKRATQTEFDKGDDLINLKSAYQIRLGFGLKSAELCTPDAWKQIRNKSGYHFPVQLGIEPDLDKDGNLLMYEGLYEFDINKTDTFLGNPNDVAKGFQFYGGNDYPKTRLKQGWVAKTFSEMAGKEETDTDKEGKRIREYATPFEETTFKRLAVMLMDVDGLGTIFRNGLPSLAAYSTLSRNLDWFFKGYLNTIWKDKYSDNTQIIYSGGDDLLIVGRWNELIDLAKEIRTEFKAFVCEHEKLSLSAGISFVTAKFPVIKAAEYAEKAEKAAKNYSFSTLEKNAISMMGVTMNWDYEFTIVENLKTDIVSFRDAKKYKNRELPNSFIFKINGYYEQVEQNRRDLAEKRTDVKEDFSWIWQMAYDLTRMKERIYERNKRTEEQSEIVGFLKDLVEWTISQKTPPSVSQHPISYLQFFKLLNLACIWASYELRNK
jgi:CRISPR-associated protein Csm1